MIEVQKIKVDFERENVDRIRELNLLNEKISKRKERDVSLECLCERETLEEEILKSMQKCFDEWKELRKTHEEFEEEFEMWQVFQEEIEWFYDESYHEFTQYEKNI